MAAFTPSSGPGNTTAVINGAANPTVANVDVTNADTEYSYVIPVGTKKFWLRVRNVDGLAAWLRVYYVSGDTVYATVNPGGIYVEQGLTTSALTIYFKCNYPNRVVEIVSWV